MPRQTPEEFAAEMFAECLKLTPPHALAELVAERDAECRMDGEALSLDRSGRFRPTPPCLRCEGSGQEPPDGADRDAEIEEEAARVERGAERERLYQDMLRAVAESNLTDDAKALVTSVASSLRFGARP